MPLARGYLHESADGFALTAAGEQWLASLDVLPNAAARGRLAYRCMDWSERQDHLAGTLAKDLLDHYLQNDWLRADATSRALRATPKGEAHLLPMFREALINSGPS